MNIYEIRDAIKLGQRIYDLPLRVTSYSRVSTDSRDQLNSLQAQTRYYDEFFDRYPMWIRVEGYVDEGITGTRTKKREDFNRMIEDAMNNNFDLILTKEVSRFARNTVDSLNYTRKLLNAGVGVFFQNDNICTLDSDGELRLTIMSSIAQEESRKISDRVKWGKQQSRNHGRVSGTNRIWGYKKNNGKLVIDEKEAKMVQLIYSMYTDGIGLRIIRKELTKLGHKSRSGKELTEATLSDILKNPKYKGWFVEGKSKIENYLDGRQKDIPRKDWIMYSAPDIIPPLVSEEIWDKCNKILTERAEKVKRKETSYQNKFLYSGILFCKKHNTAFWHRYSETKKDKLAFWKCSESLTKGKEWCNAPLIYENELEYIIRDIIKQLKSNTTPIDNLITVLTNNIKQVDYSQKILETNNELENLKTEKNNAIRLNSKGILSDEELTEQLFKIKTDVEELQLQLEKYTNQSEKSDDTISRLEKVKYLAKQYNNSIEITKEVIDALIDRIDVSGEKSKNITLEIYLKGSYNAYIATYPDRIRLLNMIQITDNKHTYSFNRFVDQWKPFCVNIDIYLNIA